MGITKVSFDGIDLGSDIVSVDDISAENFMTEREGTITISVTTTNGEVVVLDRVSGAFVRREERGSENCSLRKGFQLRPVG